MRTKRSVVERAGCLFIMLPTKMTIVEHVGAVIIKSEAYNKPPLYLIIPNKNSKITFVENFQGDFGGKLLLLSYCNRTNKTKVYHCF